MGMCGRSECPEYTGQALLTRSSHRSKFGLAFQQAAEESGAGAKHDMFDTSVVEVRQADLTSFIESLHLRSA